MYSVDDDLEFWRAAREKRRLSLTVVADNISKGMGVPVKRDALANWEYGRTKNPQRALWQAIEWQLKEWRREDSLFRETQGTYGADFTCSICGKVVVGPAAGAHYCMHCGGRFDYLVCPGCGFVEPRMDYQYCPKCGEGLVKR